MNRHHWKLLYLSLQVRYIPLQALFIANSSIEIKFKFSTPKCLVWLEVLLYSAYYALPSIDVLIRI